jgi:cell division protein FtsL
MGSSATTCILAGVTPLVVLLLTNIISVVVAVLITRHCYRNTTQKNSTSNKENTYEQVEGTKTYSNIAMNDNPAYGPLQ